MADSTDGRETGILIKNSSSLKKKEHKKPFSRARGLSFGFVSEQRKQNDNKQNQKQSS